MLLAMVRDLRVILVKLADRTHNLRTIEALPPAKRRSIARETLDIYAPVAERLGLYSMKLELEDLGFHTLYPQRYRVIERALKKARGNQKEFLSKIRAQLEAALKKAGHRRHASRRARSISTASIARCCASARRCPRSSTSTGCASSSTRSTPATARSAWCTASTSPCPGASRITSRSRASMAISRCTPRCSGPMACRSRCRSAPRTWIASPSPASRRTGSTRTARARARRSRSARASGCRTWSRWRRAATPRNSSRASRSTCFPDKVYVFTPRGEILRLPRGATVVDFAYAVHTDIGNRCVAAKIDRRLAPLRTVLRNGQTVQIITAKGATPNPSWVNFVVTAKARSAIRHYLKSLRRGEAVELGRRLLAQALAEFDLEARCGATPQRWQLGAAASSGSRTPRSCTRRSGSASGWRRWWRGGCCRRTASMRTTSMARAAARRRRWRWRAPRGCWSAMRTAAIRCRTIRSSPSSAPAAAS